MPSHHDPERLERLFDACFRDEHGTILVGGGSEPLYIVSKAPGTDPHRVVYREDYFASALHEVAHWCIAGAARREQDDYGYWYRPEGRSPEQQAEFERVESRPQALEWIFSDACGAPFELSADNLGGDPTPSATFAHAVAGWKGHYLLQGLPARAERFRSALAADFTAVAKR